MTEKDKPPGVDEALAVSDIGVGVGGSMVAVGGTAVMVGWTAAPPQPERIDERTNEEEANNGRYRRFIFCTPLNGVAIESPKNELEPRQGSEMMSRKQARLPELLTTVQHAQVNGGLLGNPKRPHVHDEKIIDQVRIERWVVHLEATVPEWGE